jgi:hypothetical protein
MNPYAKRTAEGQFTTLQTLQQEGANVQGKIEQMEYEAGLLGYCYGVGDDGVWHLRPMTMNEGRDFKLSLLRDGDMILVAVPMGLADIVRGPVELFHDPKDTILKVLVPSKYRGKNTIIDPIGIRVVFRDGEEIIRFAH